MCAPHCHITAHVVTAKLTRFPVFRPLAVAEERQRKKEEAAAKRASTELETMKLGSPQKASLIRLLYP